jgi:MFS superfamily sulfate permease-like transporter
MNKKHWEEELSTVVKGMTPIEPRFDMRAGVMQQIRSLEPTQSVTVRPLLSLRVRRVIILSIPLFMVIAYLLTRNAAAGTGSIFGSRLLDIFEQIEIPDITFKLSETLKWALMAIFLFTLLQVVNISRLMGKQGRELH